MDKRLEHFKEILERLHGVHAFLKDIREEKTVRPKHLCSIGHYAEFHLSAITALLEKIEAE